MLRFLRSRRFLISFTAVVAIVLVALGLFILFQNADDVDRTPKSTYTTERDIPADAAIGKLDNNASVPRLAIGSQPAAGTPSKVEAPTGPNLGATPSNCNPSTTHTNPSSADVMVNKKHCLVPISFTPSLAAVNCNGTTAYLSGIAAGPFESLCQATATAGVPIRVTSSFRSYSDQISTYNYWVAANGSTTAADTVSARPGFSEHQTGLSMDIATNGCALECFGGTAAYTWMQNNAASYGFIQRYYAGHSATTGYSPEPWHYRYVGTAVAQDMQARGIKTLEQYWGMTGGDYAG